MLPGPLPGFSISLALYTFPPSHGFSPQLREIALGTRLVVFKSLLHLLGIIECLSVETTIFCEYRSVPQMRPPFCNLSLSTKCRGGLIRGMRRFLLRLRPPIAVPIKHDLIVGGR